MPQRRLFEIVFIACAIALVALVGAVNCLQGTPFLNGVKCGYSLTTDDLGVKVLAGLVFVLFLGLLLGPVAASLIQPLREKRTRSAPKRDV